MEQILIKTIAKQLFDSYVVASRHPNIVFFAEELQWYANADETILGVVLIDKIDNDFASVLMGRDEGERFRAFNLETSFVKIEDAITWLTNTMKWYTRLGKTVFPQGDPYKVYKLFETNIPREHQHPSFVHLNNDDTYLPAKKLINNIMPYFIDIDGNFIEQFQTTGFDARVWELYLFSFFIENLFEIDRRYNRPDFILSKFGEKIAVEAVTVGRKGAPQQYIHLDPDEYIKKLLKTKEDSDEMAIKFGSPLFSKMNKRYWELDHVKDIPFLIAIADFHEDYSMTWSHNSLITYLYGYRHGYKYNENGNLIIIPEKIEKHIHGSKRIPSGFFDIPESENISAVLFSSSGTISKFSRMAIQAGYAVQNIKTFRWGMSHNHNENASLPNMFHYEVTEKSTETWAEGLNVFHNPKAKKPLDPDVFPGIAHHFLRKDGIIESWLPEFHPYASITSHMKLV
ncbi:hypothetical protein AGMMS49546_33320 [Spirochaetia bacterium]|nr:hypothetical protein AGMMS49546_33320 [Spirochaetia bacterium]